MATGDHTKRIAFLHHHEPPLFSHSHVNLGCCDKIKLADLIKRVTRTGGDFRDGGSAGLRPHG